MSKTASSKMLANSGSYPYTQKRSNNKLLPLSRVFIWVIVKQFNKRIDANQPIEHATFRCRYITCDNKPTLKNITQKSN